MKSLKMATILVLASSVLCGAGFAAQGGVSATVNNGQRAAAVNHGQQAALVSHGANKGGVVRGPGQANKK